MTSIDMSKVSRAYDLIAEGYAELAQAYAAAANQPPVAVAPTPSAPSQAVPADQGRCPKHGREWQEGQYGPFCSSKSDDPAWSNKRGYCSITPKNAPKWLEINGLAAA